MISLVLCPAQLLGLCRQRCSELDAKLSSNAVLLITSGFLLKNDEIIILQTTLIGSILSNMHLTLGLGFLVGGLSHKEQNYRVALGQLYGIMLLLAMAGLIVPSILSVLTVSVSPTHILRLSRIIAVFLIASYLIFLWFSTKTHSHMFQDTDEPDLQTLRDELHRLYTRKAPKRKSCPSNTTSGAFVTRNSM